MTDMSGFRNPYPIVPLSILPLPLSFCLIFDIEPNSVSMHLVISKLTYVFVSISKDFGSFSLHFPLLEFSFEFVAIWPCHHSFTFHIVVLEFSFIKFAVVCKVVFSLPMEFSIYKISFVETFFKFKATLA
jgi:hypothetical protein